MQFPEGLEDSSFRRLRPKLKFSWDSQQGRVRKTSIFIWAFWNFKLKVLKYPRNCSLHNSLMSKKILNHLINILKGKQCTLWMQLPTGLKKLSVMRKITAGVKNGLSVITSKSLSENLSNHYKHLFVCCLQDKTWIKMPNEIFFNIITSVYFDYWDFLTNFLTQ